MGRYQNEIYETQIACQTLMKEGTPTEAHIKWIQNAVRKQERKEEEDDSRYFLKKWKNDMYEATEADATPEQRKTMAKVMKGEYAAPIASLAVKNYPDKEENEEAITIKTKTKNGTIHEEQRMVISSKGIFEELGRAWSAIFNQEKKVSYQEFKERYGKYIKKSRGEIEKLKTEQIEEAIKELSNDRSIATCGWSVEEMKEIPREILELFTELLDDIEQGGEWPTFMHQVYTSMIPKVKEESTEELESGRFATIDPLQMRPINNFSPWYSAWSKARFKDMEEWRETWMPEGMHGARTGHEALEVIYEHALFMESMTAAEEAAVAVSLDWAKFFDSVQREIGQELTKEMMDEGNGKRLLEAEERLLEKIEPRFKIGDTVSKEPYKKATDSCKAQITQ